MQCVRLATPPFFRRSHSKTYCCWVWHIILILLNPQKGGRVFLMWGGGSTCAFQNEGLCLLSGCSHWAFSRSFFTHKRAQFSHWVWVIARGVHAIILLWWSWLLNSNFEYCSTSAHTYYIATLVDGVHLLQTPAKCILWPHFGKMVRSSGNGLFLCRICSRTRLLGGWGLCPGGQYSHDGTLSVNSLAMPSPFYCSCVVKGLVSRYTKICPRHDLT